MKLNWKGSWHSAEYHGCDVQSLASRGFNIQVLTHRAHHTNRSKSRVPSVQNLLLFGAHALGKLQKLGILEKLLHHRQLFEVEPRIFGESLFIKCSNVMVPILFVFADTVGIGNQFYSIQAKGQVSSKRRNTRNHIFIRLANGLGITSSRL